jgi:hypothetical protein
MRSSCRRVLTGCCEGQPAHGGLALATKLGRVGRPFSYPPLMLAHLLGVTLVEAAGIVVPSVVQTAPALQSPPDGPDAPIRLSHRSRYPAADRHHRALVRAAVDHVLPERVPQVVVAAPDGSRLRRGRKGRVVALGKRHGLRVVSRQSRALPADRRYLPPAKRSASKAASDVRLRREVIITFRKPRPRSESDHGGHGPAAARLPRCRQVTLSPLSHRRAGSPPRSPRRTRARRRPRPPARTPA